MRVLVVSAWEPWRAGDGACLVLHAHLRELAGRHDLEVLAAGAPRGRAAPPPNLPADVRWYGAPLAAPLDGLWRRAVRGDEPAHVRYVGRRALVADLRATVRERRPDVVHLFGWGTAALWRHLDGVPAVHDAVDPWSANLDNRSTSRLHALLDRGDAARVAAHEARHYPHLAAVVVRTEEDAALLRAQVPGARVAVVPNGVDAGPPPGPPAPGRVLAFLGAFDAEANVDAAEALVRDVLPLVPEGRVLLVGRDPSPRVRALAGPRVEVTGTVPDVAAALRRASVFVAPVRRGCGLRNKVLEAMAAGLPVVATSLALQGIGESSGVVRADTAEELAAVAVRLAGDAGAGAANRARVEERHTWARSAAVLEELWCASRS
ncbi:MAG: glycosyltransferase family 4 protein [Mycobacteriales bacterium]